MDFSFLKNLIFSYFVRNPRHQEAVIRENFFNLGSYSRMSWWIMSINSLYYLNDSVSRILWNSFMKLEEISTPVWCLNLLSKFRITYVIILPSPQHKSRCSFWLLVGLSSCKLLIDFIQISSSFFWCSMLPALGKSLGFIWSQWSLQFVFAVLFFWLLKFNYTCLNFLRHKFIG